MSKRNGLLPGLKRSLSLILLLLVVFSIEAKTQSLHISLDELPTFAAETPWDTTRIMDYAHLQLGQWHKVPNFLPTEFERVNTLEEFPLRTGMRFVFRWPKVYTFGFREEKRGVFTVFIPRDLETPGLEISVDFVDDVAERIRRTSVADAWRESVRSALMGMRKGVESKKGLIHVSIPIPLPKTVEKIIGKGEATSIDISGRESITFSGESRRVSPFIGVEGQQRQPLFPSLDMKQELDVRVQGTIGEKINVQVDHSSSSFAEKQNRIRLNYKGFDDDLIKLIEMGNTNLSLPGSQLVSYSTASKGLFGVKALAQVGAVDVTMIASKQEGEVSRASFTPRGAAFGQVETKVVRDIDYVKNVYFFLDLPETGKFFEPLEGEIEVFESVYDWERTMNPEMVTFPGRAWVDSSGHGDGVARARDLLKLGLPAPPYEERNFELLQVGEDYRFVLNAEDESVLGLELSRPISEDKVLAVRYVNELGDTIGDYLQFGDTLALELIKPSNPLPTDKFGYTWHYMMRHIYNLGLSNIDAASLDIQIEDNTNRLDRTTPEGSTIPYLRILGLDRTDESGVGAPDNRIDLTSGLIDLSRGILTFPTLRPFDPPPELVAEWTDSLFSFQEPPYDELLIPEIYDEFLPIPEEFHKFRIVVKASSTTKTFVINAFNIVEGSETVTLDGRKLNRGRDYDIDYLTGEVELKGDVLNDITPASRINIDYEYKPFAGGASSSLVGFNSLFRPSERIRLGTTWLYESKSSGAARPRLGEESSRSLIGDVDGYLQFESEKLTSLANKLPLVDTDARSTVTLSGEIAASFPDPNTEGEAFIDDMEGVEDSDVIPVNRRRWVWASPPVDPNDPTDLFNLESSNRERVFWYNIEPEIGVHRRDLNPELDERENTLVQSIDIEVDTVSVDSTHWVGLMAGFAGGGLDLSRGQFIEIWVNDFKPDSMMRGGVLYIEMGGIDEDFFEPDKNEYNAEDKNRDGFSALTEDAGLDGVFDVDEVGVGADPAGDNYSPNRINGRFEKINGTERNGLEDDEDLDNSGQLDRDNNYFRFKINLSDSAVIDVQRDFPGRVVDPADSWRLYRISLSEAEVVSQSGAAPMWERIHHVRIWFDNVARVVNPSKKRIQIAEFKVVGNRWEADGIRSLADTLLMGAERQGARFEMGVISTKTDPVRYRAPFNPGEQENIAIKEQSLFLKYEQLGPGAGLRIKKRFPGNGLDFTTYDNLHFWVHTDVADDSLEYFFRVAFDSLNYYEVTVPFRPEFVGGGWILASVKLMDLSGLKFQQVDSLLNNTLPVVEGVIVDAARTDRSYPVKMVGRPNLFSVRFLYAGLRNRSTSSVFFGEIWLDDIYLGAVKRDIDYAQRVSASVSLANVLNVNFGWRRTGPDFHGINQRRGAGSLINAINLNGKTKLEHFIPLFGFSVPVSVNYSKSTSLPKFQPSSDTEIADKAIQDSLRTERVTEGFSTTLSKSGSKNPFLKYTFDKIRANFSMSRSRGRSPSSIDTLTSMTGTFDYQMSWSRKRNIRVFKGYTFRYWLNSVSFRMRAERRSGTRYRFVSGQLVRDPYIYSAGLESSGSATYVPFPSLTSSFRMSLKRDGRLPHKWLGVDIGREIRRSEQLQLTYKPPNVWLIGTFSPDFNYSSSYNEDSSPNIRKQGDPRGVRNVSGGRTASVKMKFDLGGWFLKFFDLVGLGEKRDGKGGPGKGPSRPSSGDNGKQKGDKTAAPEDTTTGEKKRDPLVALRKIGGILSGIRKINASIQHRVQSSYTRIPDRPSLAYQLGFTKRSGVSWRGIDYDNPERYSRTMSISMDSGTKITKNIDLAGRYSTSLSWSTFRGSESKTRNTSWPDVNLSWHGLQKLGAFRTIFSSASATMSYKRSTQQSGRGDGVDSENSSTQISPSIVAKWNNGLNTTLAFSMNKRSSSSFGSKSDLTSMTLSMDMKYRFKPGKGFRIPLPFASKRMKLKSSLDTSLNISYTRSGGQRFNPNLALAEDLPGTNSLRVSPKLTYNFSRTLNGSFFVDYSRSYSEATNQTTTTVRVGINAIFTF